MNSPLLRVPHRPTNGSERGRLSATVKEHLTQRIVAGVLRPNDELPSESELAAQFKVSKPVIREALGSLAGLGLVQIRQGRPTIVQGLTSAPLDQFFGVAMGVSENGLREALELRRALETEAAALAATRASPQHIERLGEIIASMRKCPDDLDAWLPADLAFHMALVRSTGNSLLQFLIEALSDVMRQSINALGSQTDLRDPATTLKRHERVFEAVCAHDPEAARAAMHAHFAATHDVVLAIGKDQTRLSR